MLARSAYAAERRDLPMEQQREPEVFVDVCFKHVKHRRGSGCRAAEDSADAPRRRLADLAFEQVGYPGDRPSLGWRRRTLRKLATIVAHLI